MLADFFRKVESAEGFRALCPELTIGALTDARASVTGDPLLGQRDRLTREGFMELPALISSDRARAMASAITRLCEAGIPEVFAYVFDEFWSPLDALDAPASAALGDYEVLADAWAWRILPGKSNHGWSPHRGAYVHEARDDGTPRMLNVWIALTDATPDNACMYIVPLDRDPAYPNDLAQLDAPLEAVRALPAPAGTALLWNANALHWGGASSEHAKSPRISFSYTLRARDAKKEGFTWINPRSLDFRARLDLIALQIAIYGEIAGVAENAREWAKVTRGLVTRH